MKVQLVNRNKYFLSKYLNYFILFFLVVSIGLVFGFKHTTFNLIEILKLPTYFYTIGYVSVAFFLIAFLVEMFSKIDFIGDEIVIEQNAILKDGLKVAETRSKKFSLIQVSKGSEIEGRNIWKVILKNGNKESLYVLLNYDESIRLKEILT